MKTETAVLLILAVAVIGGGIWYMNRPRQPASLTPEQMLASGVGNLVGGIAGLVTA